METTSNVPHSGHRVAPPSINHVLLMHGDDVIVSMLNKKLYVCLHKVAKIFEAQEAVLRVVKENASKSDMVICEVVDMVVQDLIKLIESEVNIPVIVVSPGSHYVKVLNCPSSGACWCTSEGHMQYAVDKKMVKEADQLENPRKVDHGAIATSSSNSRDNEKITASNEGLKRKNRSDEPRTDQQGCSSQSKRRVIWTSELHKVFVDAVQKLGIENAVPKKILDMMNRPELTRDNVASHLQKYRDHIRKQQQQQNVHQVQKNELRGRGCRFTSSPSIRSTVTSNPVPICSWQEPNICQTPQMNFQTMEPSESIVINGTSSFDNIDNVSQLGSFAFDDDINLVNQGYSWDPQGPYDPYQIEGSYGGESGLYWPNGNYNHSSDAFFLEDGSATGLFNGYVNQEFFTESNRPVANIPRDNNENINIGNIPSQNNNNSAPGIQSHSSAHNTAQGGGKSYTAAPIDIPSQNSSRDQN